MVSVLYCVGVNDLNPELYGTKCRLPVFMKFYWLLKALIGLLLS